MNGYWWSVLGIEPTSTPRDVRRAYAKLLRVTRPDDDPEGFQRLHDAYKIALSVAESPPLIDSEVTGETVETINLTFEDGQAPEFEGGPVAVQVYNAPVPENPVTEQQLAIIEEHSEKAEKLLQTPINARSISKWTFLTESPELLDDGFRIELGRRVLSGIITFNNKDSKNHQPIPPHIVTMLDDTFFWTSAPYMFTNPASLADVLNTLESVDPGLRHVSARPVGGHIVEVKKKTNLKDPADSVQTESSWGPFSIFCLIWVAGAILKACVTFFESM